MGWGGGQKTKGGAPQDKEPAISGAVFGSSMSLHKRNSKLEVKGVRSTDEHRIRIDYSGSLKFGTQFTPPAHAKPKSYAMLPKC